MISRRNVLTALPALCVGGAVLQAQGAQGKPARWQTWEYHGFDVTLHEFSSKLLSESPLKSLGEDGWSIAFQALVGTDSEQRVRIEMKRPLGVSPQAVWEFTQFDGNNSQVYSEMIAEGWQLCGQMRIENGLRFTAQRSIMRLESIQWEYHYDEWTEEFYRTRECKNVLQAKGVEGWRVAGVQVFFSNSPRAESEPYRFFFERPVKSEQRTCWAFTELVAGSIDRLTRFDPRIIRALNRSGTEGWEIGAIIEGSEGSGPGYRCLLQRAYRR